MARPHKPVTAKSPVIQALFSEIERSGLTDTWICQEIGLAKNTLARVRYEPTRANNLSLIEKICEAMGVEIRLVPKGMKLVKDTHVRKALRRGCEVPPELEDQWQFLKRQHLTNAEAAAALKLEYLGDRK